MQGLSFLTSKGNHSLNEKTLVKYMLILKAQPHRMVNNSPLNPMQFWIYHIYFSFLIILESENTRVFFIVLMSKENVNSYNCSISFKRNVIS